MAVNAGDLNRTPLDCAAVTIDSHNEMIDDEATFEKPRDVR